jgi:hypothetical protein
MSADASRPLRITLVVLIVLLALQFELGTAVNLSDLHAIPAFGFSVAAILSALAGAGGEAVVHGVLGTFLALGAFFALARSLAAPLLGVRILGVLLVLAMALAAINGYLFVLSGFHNDGYSHGMATGFIVTLLLCFLELYILKPATRA